MIRSTPFTGRFSVHVGPPKSYGASTTRSVDDIWSNAVKERPYLRNGRLFSVHRVDQQQFIGAFVEYKFWVAQRARPDLRTHLQVAPLGVNGIVRTSGRIVAARRGAHVLQDSGLWELAPSGSLDDSCAVSGSKLDAEGQLLRELEEELGLGRTCVESLVPLGAVHDLNTNVRDLVFEIEVNMPPQSVRDAFERVRAAEYTEVELLGMEDIPRFVEQHRSAIAPSMVAILDLYRTAHRGTT